MHDSKNGWVTIKEHMHQSKILALVAWTIKADIWHTVNVEVPIFFFTPFLQSNTFQLLNTFERHFVAVSQVRHGFNSELQVD